MREFNEPYYTGPDCVCCTKSESQVIAEIWEKFDAEQKRSRIGFIQYKRIEELIGKNKETENE
jgi:hypothetical protein